MFDKLKNLFQKKQKPVPVPQQPSTENIFQKELKLTMGRLIFLDGCPFFITALFPKTKSITLTRLTEKQFKRLQEASMQAALAMTKAKAPVESSQTPPEPGK